MTWIYRAVHVSDEDRTKIVGHSGDKKVNKHCKSSAARVGGREYVTMRMLRKF